MSPLSLRRRSRVDGVPVTAALLDAIGFTDHALVRFAERAGLTSSNRTVIEPIIRGLLLSRGQVVSRRPAWGRSDRCADIFLVLEDWMLFIGCHDRRRSSVLERYAIVTAINRPGDDTWRTAWRRGHVSVPPPPDAGPQPHLLVSITHGLRGRRASESPLHAIRRVHRARCRRAQSAREAALVAWWQRTARPHAVSRAER